MKLNLNLYIFNNFKNFSKLKYFLFNKNLYNK